MSMHPKMNLISQWTLRDGSLVLGLTSYCRISCPCIYVPFADLVRSRCHPLSSTCTAVEWFMVEIYTYVYM